MTIGKKGIRIIIISIILLIVIPVGLSYFYFTPYVSKQLKQAVVKSTDGLYRIEFENLRINLYLRKVHINSVKLIPDGNNELSLQKGQLIELGASEFILTGIKYRKLIKEGLLELGTLRLNNPTVKILQLPKLDIHIPKQDSIVLKESIIKGINIKIIQLQKGALIVYDMEQKTITHSLSAFDIKISSLDYAILNKQLQYQNIEAKLTNYTMLTDSMYVVHFGKADLNTAGQTLVTDSVELRPRHEKYQYSKQFGYRKLWNRIQLGRISLTGLDTEKLRHTGQLSIGTAHITHFDVELFNDKRYPKKPGKINKTLQEILTGIKMPMMLDSIILENGHVRFEQLDQTQRLPWRLDFAEIHGQITGLRNDSAAVANNAHVKVFLKQKALRQADLTLALDLPLAEQSHRLDIILGSYDLTKINSHLERYGLLRIESGKVDKLTVGMQILPNQANGTLELLYSDLSITILSKKKDAKKRKLVSMLANAGVVRKSNPLRNNPARTATINLYNTNNKPFVGFWMDALLDGLEQIIVPKMDKEKRKQRERTRKGIFNRR